MRLRAPQCPPARSNVLSSASAHRGASRALEGCAVKFEVDRFNALGAILIIVSENQAEEYQLRALIESLNVKKAMVHSWNNMEGEHGISVRLSNSAKIPPTPPANALQ